MKDEELLKQLYDASYRRLVGHLTAFTGSRTEAEDVVQEAFVRAVVRPRAVLDADSPEAWLRVVAINVARSRWRRLKRFTGLLPELATEDHPSMTPDRVALEAAVRRLSPTQRDAITLHHFADLSVEEVARTLDVPVGTVKARLARGRAALAVLLGPDPVEAAHD